MTTSGDDVLIEVIAVLRSRRQDLRTIKLEDAKTLTVQVIRRRRAMATDRIQQDRPTIGFAGCSLSSTR
ncbi:MAG: hypothetical protein P8J37_17420 [Fuerstiella sp.]|jgi:hypothetical protein|nr:hypothetical protein [Fuerstiella sp.]